MKEKIDIIIEKTTMYFQKASQLCMSKLIWLVYVSLSLYITHRIFEELQVFEVKQLLLGLISVIIFFRVHRFLLSIRSARYARGSDFNDALASELMRVQWKLDQLINNIHPYFKTPKERAVDPMQDHIYFREFVEKCLAYRAYPGVATFETLENSDKMQDQYDLCLNKNSVELKKNCIYLQNVNNKVSYSMVAAFDTPVHDIMTDIDAPEKFTLNSLNKLKDKITWFAITQGHIELPAILILKKSDGINYYDPLSTGFTRNISEQDLINLNGSGPLSYKTISIRKGSILRGYVYDRENLGYLRPDQSLIKIISIDKDNIDYKKITVEIQPIYGEYSWGMEGKKRGDSIIKTISYFDDY